MGEQDSCTQIADGRALQHFGPTYLTYHRKFGLFCARLLKKRVNDSTIAPVRVPLRTLPGVGVDSRVFLGFLGLLEPFPFWVQDF